MKILKSIAISFSMFSHIPMPHFTWQTQNMRYTMAFFPLVGLVVGAIVTGWAWVCSLFSLGGLLQGAGFAILPVLLTGGIHLDGLCDTADALASHANQEKKLAILQDSHIGAFGAIALALYLLAFTAVTSELAITWPFIFGVIFLFVLSRSLSGLAVVFFPCAKNSGLVHTFADAAARKSSAIILATFFLLSSAGLLFFARWGGLFAIIGALLTLLYYRRTALKQFGGITGDLAGWFLQLCELVGFIGLLLSQKIL